MTASNTPVHRAPALLKLAIMLAVTAIVFSGITASLAVTSALIALVTVLAKTSAGTIARNVKIVFWYGIFVAVFRIAGKPLESSILLAEIRASAYYIWQLAVILLAGSVFFETTGTTEIGHALSSLQKAVRWKAPLPDIAFLLSLTIGFIPRIFDAWVSLDKAWTARGGSLHRGIGGAFRRITTLVPLLVIRLMAIAADTDRAIRNRSIP